MKKWIIRIASFALLFAVMALIFSFSAENAVKSSNTSGTVIKTVAKIVNPQFKKMTSAERDSIISWLQSPIRRIAHFSAFALLGFLAVNAMMTFIIKMRYRALIAATFCLLYAVSDEVHQLFSPGRAFELSDICIDTVGSIIGIITYIVTTVIIAFIITKHRTETQSGVLLADNLEGDIV